jgi:hypothetical protein
MQASTKDYMRKEKKCKIKNRYIVLSYNQKEEERKKEINLEKEMKSCTFKPKMMTSPKFSKRKIEKTNQMINGGKVDLDQWSLKYPTQCTTPMN